MTNTTHAAKSMLAAAVLLICGCQHLRVEPDLSASADTAARSKELLHRFYKDVFVHWNMTVVDELVAPQFRSHDWPVDHPSGPKGFRDFYAWRRTAFPDLRYTVEDLIAEGDRVVVRWRQNGTHQGDFLGVAATGRPMTMRGIAIYRVEGGKLIERWVVVDLHGLLEQLRAPSSKAGVE